MTTSEVARALLVALVRAYPSAVRRVVTEALDRSLPDDARRRRDALLIEFLKVRGVRDANHATVARRLREQLNNAESVAALANPRGLPTLRALSELWLTPGVPGVEHLAARFQIAGAGGSAEPPSKDEVEVALRGTSGRALEDCRASAIALVAVSRLGPLRNEAAAEQRQPVGVPQPEQAPADNAEIRQLKQPPMEEIATVPLPTIASILEQIATLAADDPGWSDLDTVVSALRARGGWAADERDRATLTSRIAERIAALWLEYVDVVGVLALAPPSLTPASGMDLSEVERRVQALAARFGAIRRHSSVLPTDLAGQIAFGQRMTALLDEARAAHASLGQMMVATAVAPPAVLDGPKGLAEPPIAEPAPPVAAAPTARPPEPLQPTERRSIPSVTPVASSVASPKTMPMPQFTTVGQGAPLPNPPPDAVIRTSQAPQIPSQPIPSAEELAELEYWDISDGTVMCLDFGTARSKAMAVRADGEPVFLEIGKHSKSDYDNSIASSVWFDARAKVLCFGDEAIRRSLVQGQYSQQRIDSLKDFLAMPIGDRLPDPHEYKLPREFDREGHDFSHGEVLLLYLAYFMWAAEKGLAAQGLSIDTRRRFAIPSWPNAHRSAGIELLRNYLCRATLLARHVGDRWLNGLPIDEAKGLARLALGLPTNMLPEHLFMEGITEPLAAIGTRGDELSENGGLVLIVDVGAGTTDFGLYLVTTARDRPRFIEVATHSIKRAGNQVDELLSAHILDKLGSGLGIARTPVEIELQLKRRDIKERVFRETNDGRDGRVQVVFQAGPQLTVERNAFLALPQVRSLAAEFRQGLYDTIQRAEFDRAAEAKSVDWARYQTVRLVLTGGGATLPMLTALIDSSFAPERNAAYKSQSVEVRFTRTAQRPEAVPGRLDTVAYLPLAVAWGGAMPELPTQGKPVGLATVPETNWARIEKSVVGAGEHWSDRKA